MSSFALSFHSQSGRRVVEVWEGDQIVACIYPGDQTGATLRVVSKFEIAVDYDPGLVKALNIKIGSR